MGKHADIMKEASYGAYDKLALKQFKVIATVKLLPPRRPQGRADMPYIGIFAQRAKHQPNPIGITSVRLLGVEGDMLKVQGLDAIDETPVLDIKPYFSQYDSVTDSHNPEWVDRLMSDYF